MSDDVAPGVNLVTKSFVASEINLTPGERSMVAWISTDQVDLEADVVVPSGVDFKHYLESNPIVVAIHDLGKWPIGQCQWIKLKKNGSFNGLVAKSDFDSDPDSEVVWNKVARRTLRSVSIGFIPPDDLKPGEWGPPTPDELRRRPDWSKARRIIRRCVLKEYSICPIGMNPAALIFATSKGFHKPNFSIPKAPTMAQTDVPPEAEEDEKACECGEKDCKCDGMAEGSGETGGAVVKPKAVDEEEIEEEPVAEDEAEEPEDAEEDEGEDEPEEIGPLKRYDHASVKSPHYKGFGRVESLHTKGHVPHASNHMMGSKEDPAACIKCYRKMGDGHVPTEDHIAVKVAHLTKLGTPLNPPSKKSAPKPTTKTVRTEPAVEPLPTIVAKSDQEVRAELIAKLNEMLSPEGFRKIAREEAERAAGYV